jgi:hypothetical protein
LERASRSENFTVGAALGNGRRTGAPLKAKFAAFRRLRQLCPLKTLQLGSNLAVDDSFHAPPSSTTSHQ